MPSENLSRRIVTRVGKWIEEKEQRVPKTQRGRNRIHSNTNENPISVSNTEQTLSPKAYATVAEVHADEVLVDYNGNLLHARLAPSLFFDTSTRSPITVGDQVEISFQDDGQARVETVLPRRSSLTRGAGDASRRTSRRQTHLLAANIDQVIVVCSAAKPSFRPRLIDRYLVAASRDGIPTILCVNKVDLGVSTATKTYLEGYSNLGIIVLLTSSITGEGVISLIDVIRGKKSLLTGHSGVGKSSILNAMEPGLAIRVGKVTQTIAGQGKGTHTTASSRLVPLSLPGTFVVDTPGIRSFGISGLVPKELAAHFPDIDSLAAYCTFRDCLHDGDQGCALPSSIVESSFLRARWASYRKLLRELG